MDKRHLLFTTAKLLFAAGILTWLFHKVGVARVSSIIGSSHPLPFILGTVLCFGTVAIAGWRWHRLLIVFGISIPVPALICVTWIGQFFMMFLPGPAGDDLTRMLYISRLAKGRTGEACTSVVLDRCMGLAAVLLLALFCIPGQWSLLLQSNQTHGMALGMLGGGGLVCLCGATFFLFGHPSHRWFEKGLRRLPASNLHDEIVRIWGLLCSNKRSLIQVVAAALVTQILICGMFFLAGKAVGVSLPFSVWAGFIPIVLASNILPITVAGIGVREYLLVLFLGVLAHVENDLALAASLAAFGMMLVTGLVGGLLYLLYRPAPVAGEDRGG